MIQIRLAESPEDAETCLRLRWTVFVEEQGVRPSLEVDDHDRKDAVHAVVLWDGVPCATGRFIFEKPGLAKIQRMAVVDDVRKRGVGRRLLAFLEEEARRRGASRFMLWAQTYARPFYEKAGYAAEGEQFDDAGIPHIAMCKDA